MNGWARQEKSAGDKKAGTRRQGSGYGAGESKDIHGALHQHLHLFQLNGGPIWQRAEDDP